MKKALLILLVVLNLLAWSAALELSRPRSLEVIFFDVGQGDAALIKTPGRHLILIDGGFDETVAEKLSREMPFWSREIDLVVLSHPHTDHLGGLLHVLERYQVNHIIWYPYEVDSSDYQRWVEEIDGRSVFEAERGMRVLAGGSILEILHPEKDENYSDANDASVVAHVSHGRTSFLFTGDINSSVEKNLNIQADVLKVAHHGSRTSSSLEFLETVNPQQAVISSGRGNSYNHPHPEIVERITNLGIRLLRTDRDKDIRIIANQ